MPDDALIHIMLFLELRDRFKLRIVCRRIRDILQNNNECWPEHARGSILLSEDEYMERQSFSGKRDPSQTVHSLVFPTKEIAIASNNFIRVIAWCAEMYMADRLNVALSGRTTSESWKRLDEEMREEIIAGRVSRREEPFKHHDLPPVEIRRSAFYDMRHAASAIRSMLQFELEVLDPAADFLLFEAYIDKRHKNPMQCVKL